LQNGEERVERVTTLELADATLVAVGTIPPRALVSPFVQLLLLVFVLTVLFRIEGRAT
jgi:hypothetical protein